MPTKDKRGNKKEDCLQRLKTEITLIGPIAVYGTVKTVKNELIEVEIPRGATGDLVEFHSHELGEIISSSDKLKLIAPITTNLHRTVQVSDSCRLSDRNERFIISNEMLGAVIDASFETVHRFATPTNDSNFVHGSAGKSSRLLRFGGRPKRVGYHNRAPSPFERQEISEQLSTGIRAIDGFVPIGIGQRLAVIAEAGVGKSTLLRSLALHAAVDVSVVALIGERGREVGEFVSAIESAGLGAKVIVVAATSDESATRRKYAALTAQSIAEYFRDQGHDVLLLVDSLSRWARAIRDLSAACGEIPIRKGYPAAIFAALPKLIERAGTAKNGSITALYTLLASADLDEDPMVEEVRGLTDGHIILSRERAERGVFPAVDLLRSLSRVTERIVDARYLTCLKHARNLLARAARDRDMVMLGAKVDAELDMALRFESESEIFVTQKQDSPEQLQITQKWLIDYLANQRNGVYI